MDVGPQSKSDRSITAKCRLHQSKYRANVLKEDYGYGPHKNSKHRYGNILVDGQTTGSNFLTTYAFEFAKQKVLDRQINPNLTIDEYRLFNNMLSSMPMCFNLFSDLRYLIIQDQDETSQIAKALFSEINWVETLTYVDVEFIPVPIQDYIDDKTAFDAMLLVKDRDGKKGLVSIETKYVDVHGNNPARESQVKNDLVSTRRVFDKDYTGKLIEEGYKQIQRNYLLTYAYARKNKIKNFANVIISPEFDKSSSEELEEVKKHLTKNPDSLFKITLEEFVRRGINCHNQNYSGLMQMFKRRYLVTS